MECIKYLNVTLLFIVICAVFAELIIRMNLVFFIFMTFTSEEVLTLPTLFVMILVRFICSMYETTIVPNHCISYIKIIYGDAWIDLLRKPLLKEVS